MCDLVAAVRVRLDNTQQATNCQIRALPQVLSPALRCRLKPRGSVAEIDDSTGRMVAVPSPQASDLTESGVQVRPEFA